MAQAHKVRLRIVTADAEIFNEEADLIIAPGGAGELGIQARHIPIVTTLKPGELRVEQQQTEKVFAVTGGFLEVRNEDEGSAAIVLANAAEPAENIDVARAEAARQRAEERLAQRAGNIDAARAEAAPEPFAPLPAGNRQPEPLPLQLRIVVQARHGLESQRRLVGQLPDYQFGRPPRPQNHNRRSPPRPRRKVPREPTLCAVSQTKAAPRPRNWSQPPSAGRRRSTAVRPSAWPKCQDRRGWWYWQWPAIRDRCS